MITINLISPTGGSGRTSIALNLALLLHELGRDVLLVQADPVNMMTYQLGLEHRSELGLAHCLSEGRALSESIVTADSGLRLLPFGDMQGQDLYSVQNLLARTADPLLNLMGQPPLHDKTVMVVDLPRWPNVWCERFMAISDMNLITMTPDSGSVLSCNALLPALQNSRGASYFLMNRFESTHVLHLDIWTLCKIKLGHRLLPFYLHQDQALPESFATGSPLKDYAPLSQLTEDFQKLSNWIDLEIG
ncbi:MAG TPA: cellulose biosynthesis protein BcsQ [Limnobacter sp.]|uniref:cellulose biosynthesis protein BcsQ n=1 Tax=Limnobacter sp. TaxID=2003368 RepID=UPI002E322B8F|nr:cellulose biosynthesis protein BcsQ [Limnobacter sp.]HEX5484455.1 cellulose biosynthesis protein BcsQ [Limnobacter sp.]